MKPRAFFSTFLAALGTASLAISFASAQTLQWDGNNTGGGVTNAGNPWLNANQWWNGTTNQNWVSGADAIFGGTILDSDPAANTTGNAGNVTLASPTTVGSITIGNAPGGAWGLGTNGVTLTINSGVTHNGDRAVTFNSEIILGGAQTWTNNSSTLLRTANGRLLDIGTHALTIDGTGTIQLGEQNNNNAALTGSGDLIKNGTGVFLLGGNTGNTFTGNITVNNGVFSYGDNPASMGTGNLHITNGVLESRWTTGLARTQGTNAGEIQITGGESGFAMNGNNTATFNIGAITWGSSTFNPDKFLLQNERSQGNSHLIFSSAINLNGANRTIVTNGGITGGAYSTVEGAITNGSGTGGLIVEGNGNLVLSGTNTYNGGTQVNGGKLTAASTAALPGWDSSGNISVASGATLGVTVSGWSSADIDTLIGNVSWADATSSLGFFTPTNTTYSADITFSRDIVKYGSATLTLNSDLSGFGGTLILEQGTIARAVASGDLVTNTIEVQSGTISAPIGGATEVIKTTGGLVTLSGANTYSGGFTLNAGQIAIPNVATYNGFGTGLLTLNGGSLRTVNTTNAIGINNDVQWNGDVGFGRSGGGNPIFTFNGNVTLGASVSAFTQSGTEPYSLTFNGNIGESAPGFGLNLNAASSGSVWTFNGQNTFTGNLTTNGKATVIGGSGYLGGGNYAGTIALGANAPLTYSSSADQILSGNITGTGTSRLIKDTSDSSILTLSGTNTYNGGTTVSAGTLVFRNTAAKPGANTHAFAAGTTLGLGVGGAGFFSATDITNAFAGNMVGNLSNVTVSTTTNIGIDTTNGDFTYADDIVGDPTRGLTKLGENTLVLSGNNTYTGATTVSGGTLIVNGSLAGASVVVDTTLGGSGVMGNATLSGSGSVDPGSSPGILTASNVDPSGGLDFNFEFTAANTLPDWGNPTASINDVLRLTSATPFTSALTSTNVISLYLGVTELEVGDVFTGGFYTDNDADFLSMISGATFQYFLSDPGGSVSYAGNNYSQYTGNLFIEWETIQQTADFLDGTVNGYVTRFLVTPEPSRALLFALGALALLARRRR